MESFEHPIEAQEVAKPPSRAEQMLADFDVQGGEPIPGAVLQEIIRQNEPEITEGLSRNFYHPIKMTLYTKRWQPIQGKNFVILPVRSWEERPERTKADFVWFLDKPTTEDARTPNDGYKLIITCSAKTDQVEAENRLGLDGVPRFMGADAFSVDRMSTGNMPMTTLRDYKTREEVLRQDTSTPDDQAKYEIIRNFLEQALVLPEQFPDADARIDSIFQDHQFQAEDAEKLKRAIWEFGNYDYKTRTGGFDMIGDCLVIPNEFESFVRRRYKIELQQAELSGAYQQKQDYTPEELAELAAEKEGTAVHIASVYNNTMVIDWTSRQFDKKRPIPEIIDLDEGECLKSRIKIFGNFKPKVK